MTSQIWSENRKGKVCAWRLNVEWNVNIERHRREFSSPKITHSGEWSSIDSTISQKAKYIFHSIFTWVGWRVAKLRRRSQNWNRCKRLDPFATFLHMLEIYLIKEIIDFLGNAISIMSSRYKIILAMLN